MHGAMARAHDQLAHRAAGPHVRASPLLSSLFILFAGFALLRVALNPLLLDLLVNYTSDSGSIVEKLHPALYGFVGVAVATLLCFRVVLTAWEVRVIRAMMAFVAGIIAILVATALVGRGGSAGFLIDTYVGACSAALLFLFPEPWRAKVGTILVSWLTLSAFVAVFEFVLKMRILPFSETEYSFRPTGLSGHPLDLGLWTATAIPFGAAMPWRRPVKICACAILVLGLAASGARTALIVGLFAALLITVGSVGAGLPSRRRLKRRIIVVTASLVAIPLLAALLYGAGALDRFQEGFVDANARARVDIYGVFDHMSWNQILFGMNPAAMREIAKVYFGLEFVESSVVIFVTLFGALGTAFMVALFAWLMCVLLTGARATIRLGALVFFLLALSANGLSTKGASIFLLFTLVIAFRPIGNVRGATFQT